MDSPPIVVMGVSAVGKTTVGRALAELIGGTFADADDLHPRTNVEKMSAGEPLTDDDRAPWLDRVGEALRPGTVMACSALKRAYRDVLRGHAPDTRFVHLKADAALIADRASRRRDHFMPPALLQSQLDALEPLAPDEPGVTVDADEPPDALAARAAAGLGLIPAPG
ncbi:carbohydrate kinase (thermoresistant glucokinase family) [Microbacterium resistens]|uniref:Gluconokinase n=1 Tax=Microbacterium resistens TaxID=156977 RepID=A0ABU1SBY6_9MICO|nr:gluconokinase [Microbacterium resistens]MDR6867103.1 carbohydrate kinase (thermoresistant glucokinase family) [Microbacterium resistens]